jgi:hypothetical protein
MPKQMKIAGLETDVLRSFRDTKYGFADLIARRGADVVQPDGRPAGGVSEWIAPQNRGMGMELPPEYVQKHKV